MQEPKIWRPANSSSETAIPIGLLAGALAIQAAVLLAMGQPPICTCGAVKLWHGLASSPETSQHLTDWYTFSHVIHGVVFYWLLGWAVPRASPLQRFVLALALEVGWEVLENTPFIIERYRQSALAQGYVGDSVVNSLFDTLAMAAGYLLAWALPARTTIVIVVVMELGVLYAIRDNLMLNIVQLISPSEILSRWQSGR